MDAEASGPSKMVQHTIQTLKNAHTLYSDGYGTLTVPYTTGHVRHEVALWRPAPLTLRETLMSYVLGVTPELNDTDLVASGVERTSDAGFLQTESAGTVCFYPTRFFFIFPFWVTLHGDACGDGRPPAHLGMGQHCFYPLLLFPPLFCFLNQLVVDLTVFKRGFRGDDNLRMESVVRPIK